VRAVGGERQLKLAASKSRIARGQVALVGRKCVRKTATLPGIDHRSRGSRRQRPPEFARVEDNACQMARTRAEKCRMSGQKARQAVVDGILAGIVYGKSHSRSRRRPHGLQTLRLEDGLDASLRSCSGRFHLPRWQWGLTVVLSNALRGQTDARNRSLRGPFNGRTKSYQPAEGNEPLAPSRSGEVDIATAT